MPSFKSSEKQAEQAAQRIKDENNISFGTERNYEAALKQAAEWLKENKEGDLKDISKEQADRYLAERSESVGQSQLDQDRQALQANIGQELDRVLSEKAEALDSRAYTQEQTEYIKEGQQSHNSLATQVAQEAGVRAHELHTIRPAEERPADNRNWSNNLHDQRGDVVRYTVEGKGGLVREVAVSRETANRLEAVRREQPVNVYDRGIRYESHYRIGGGNAWTQSVSRASNNELGWSNGAHGLRHSYAQDRMETLQQAGYDYKEALSIISQEMGHFREDITEVYLR